MLYIIVSVCSFLLGFIAMSLFAASGAQDRQQELSNAYQLINVLLKRVKDAESRLSAQKSITLTDENGMRVEMPLREKAS